MGVFPEDYEIFVSPLIKLWVAEGFVKPLSHKGLEELAEDCLSDLIKRSLVEVRRRNRNGEIKSIVIHDMLRELCLQKAQDEKFLLLMNSHSHGFPQGRNNERRGGLPESICKLWNLQTLLVYRKDMGNFTPDRLYLPLNIWKMPQLRHLLFDNGFFPYPLLAEVIWKDAVVLENLQTLSQVNDFRCSKEVMEIMPNLKKLGISYIHESGTEWSSYEFNNFVYLQKLETLKCEFDRDDRVGNRLAFKLALPLNLRKLTLNGCTISWENMTVIGSLPNLEVLKLRSFDFEGSVWKPNEGEFTKLMYLLIHDTSLEHWHADSTHFPQLRHLCLNFCSNLEAIPPEIGDIGSLEMIELCECSSSVVASAMLIQEEQQSLGNDGLRVRINSDVDYLNSHFKTSLRKVQSPRSQSLSRYTNLAVQAFLKASRPKS
ncbi:UNVERIFIED_CONTAM: putative disease resistance protein [Sesamum radiatum]|uniref:Disease resistance protein n=1 Tax=Sesamum radiatum TaxID=300843 RepID=A0AAW2RYG2_SESRA